MSSAGPANVVFLQAVAALVVAAVFACVAALIGGAQNGWSVGLSALAGGAACVVPNALFAWRLAWERRRPGGATVQGFFVGEFVKLALTVVILVAVSRVYRGVSWPALIGAFVIVLKSYLLMFLFGRRR